MNTHLLTNLKAYAALVGSTATALLAVFTTDTLVGQVLTVCAVLATVVGTWAAPYITEDSAGLDQADAILITEEHENAVPDSDGYIGEHEAGR